MGPSVPGNQGRAGRRAWQRVRVLEKPDLADAVIVDHVRRAWGLRVDALRFMPVGHDPRAWAYELSTADAGRYFLKVRRGAVGQAVALVRLDAVLL